MTSPDILCRGVKKYCISNGICEMTTVELPEMKTSVVVVYRPSGINFSMVAYTEIIAKIREYFTVIRREKPDFKIILTGDFNFPKDVVKWIRTEDGVIGDAQKGRSVQKDAYRQLADLAVDFDLEQIVDRVTRGVAILDLIFTDRADLFTKPKVEILQPITDHYLYT